MAYIGNSPYPNGNFSASSHNGGAAGPFAMGQSPGTKNAVLAFIDGVRQDPLNYSVSGSTITFENPGAGITTIFVEAQSIYLPNHKLQTGDEVTYHTNTGTSIGIVTAANNVAVGAYYLIEKYKLKKVAIIDFDVHHGNGTQDIFYDNEKVLYISSHQYPYYPGSGAANEKGNKDNVLNVPLNAGTQPHEFLNAYDSIFKKLKTFKPEFILLSAGFDAHKDDPLAQINLESKDYYTLTNRILTLAKKLCGGKVVSILEGGYDLNALKESVDYHVKSLMEQK